MIARLTRFYGGDPWRWLAELPLAIVDACHRAMPRLEAEEAFAGIAVNTGNLEDDAFKMAVRRWREACAAPRARARQRVNPRALAAIGIGFRRVKVAPKGPDASER